MLKDMIIDGQVIGRLDVPDGMRVEYKRPKGGEDFIDSTEPESGVKRAIFNFAVNHHFVLVPIPPQMVPLGPQDQIDWVRHKGATDRCRVNLVNQDGVVIETIGHMSWAKLETHYDRSNDHGKSWSECSKPAP